ncbi:MAG: heme-binding domain-containing protein [Nitrospirae bacterium YQR-1]
MVILPQCNPKERYDSIIISPGADKVLKRSCFDCHSNETVWPFYAKIPPFFVAMHVREGRKAINFSIWNTYSHKRREKLIQKIIEETTEGEMPPLAYLIMHPHKKPSQNDIKVIRVNAFVRGNTDIDDD